MLMALLVMSQDRTCLEVKDIGGRVKWVGEVGEGRDWRYQQFIFEFGKNILLLLSPLPRAIFT